MMRRRTGFAIATALCALVIIAALVTGGFFAAGQETSVTRLGILDQQAFAIAELGVSRAIAGWSGAVMEAALQGSTTTIVTVSAPPLESGVVATKLDSSLFLVVADGRVNSADAAGIRRRVSVLVRAERADSGHFVVHRVREQPWSEAY